MNNCKNCIYWKNQNSKSKALTTIAKLKGLSIGGCLKICKGFVTNVTPVQVTNGNVVTFNFVEEPTHIVYTTENFMCSFHKEKIRSTPLNKRK